MALRYFSRANRFSRTVSAFAEFHATTRGTASQTVKGLIKQGYLARIPSDTDGRSARVNMTDNAKAILARDPFEVVVDAAEALPGRRSNKSASASSRARPLRCGPSLQGSSRNERVGSRSGHRRCDCPCGRNRRSPAWPKAGGTAGRDAARASLLSGRVWSRPVLTKTRAARGSRCAIMCGRGPWSLSLPLEHLMEEDKGHMS
jgi:DNA-binding MarR family transcriptional regulator